MLKPLICLCFLHIYCTTAPPKLQPFLAGSKRKKRTDFLKSVRFLCAPCNRYKLNILWQFHRSGRVEVLIDFREIHEEKH